MRDVRSQQLQLTGDGFSGGNASAMATHHQPQTLLLKPVCCAVQRRVVCLPQMEPANDGINGFIFYRLQHFAGIDQT